ncbi:c-type cytochrome [Pseudobacteriovorax antillogorgiicola]|uniref:Cytochrome C oxidase, cbb3-type, subunit III n=1 Tax=Pseudobacteriovorax antillogorgiicola TaxID=1513793 RepID=A0A1Y6CAR2_9BACT|nr:cytochrome c [Pseudobacteriovorax antillogorgiicola]TCS49828.1 cbb3-type cytochrome c oxidase subunit III [Pseudobacteriovorax antillogorgiicola]SMF43355.1 Cytochrome C oxidase, cbb3-type, subunit III [Pseudobacteriovorax antillogorgiicola]
MKRLLMISSLVLFTACGGDSGGSDDTPATPETPANPGAGLGGDEDATLKLGQELYAQRCSACHGILADSTKKGRSSEAIKLAISNVPQMSGISLSDDEVEAIATALNEN